MQFTLQELTDYVYKLEDPTLRTFDFHAYEGSKRIEEFHVNARSSVEAWNIAAEHIASKHYALQEVNSMHVLRDIHECAMDALERHERTLEHMLRYLVEYMEAQNIPVTETQVLYY